MGFIKEFRNFAVKGNAIDMAVGVIIGAAFGKVVTSLVSDIITPLLGLLTPSKMDFTGLIFQLNTDNALKYGAFLDTLINFLIVSFAIFIVIRQINRLRIPFFDKVEKAPVPTTKECPFCYSTIAIKATRCPSCTSKLDESGK